MKDIRISRTLIDETLYGIFKKLLKKHGYSEAENIMYPLKRYVLTDRIPRDYLCALCSTTSRQKTAIANRLEKGGSVDEATERIAGYLDELTKREAAA